MSKIKEIAGKVEKVPETMTRWGVMYDEDDGCGWKFYACSYATKQEALDVIRRAKMFDSPEDIYMFIKVEVPI